MEFDIIIKINYPRQKNYNHHKISDIYISPEKGSDDNSQDTENHIYNKGIAKTDF